MLRLVCRRDLTIRHHYTDDALCLHPYRHKGYWFHGRTREREAMIRFAEIIRPGDTIVEVGGTLAMLLNTSRH